MLPVTSHCAAFFRWRNSRDHCVTGCFDRVTGFVAGLSRAGPPSRTIQGARSSPMTTPPELKKLSRWTRPRLTLPSCSTAD